MNYIQLEKKKLNSAFYMNISGIITLCALVIVLVIIAASKFESMDSDIQNFMNPRSITNIALTLSLASFSILTTVIFSKLIIEEYTTKKAILLFSYPINRSVLLNAKLITVLLFITKFMLASNVVVFGIIYTFGNLIDFHMPLSSLPYTIVAIIMALLITQGMALLSLQIGFVRKSVQSSIITNVILVACISNVLQSKMGFAILSVISVIIVAFVTFTLKIRIQNMEV